MKTAAIIVNHNNQDDLKKLVTRIKNYDVFDAVVIVDNKSDDIAEVEKIVSIEGTAAVEDITSVEDIASAEKAVIGKVMLLKAERNGGYGYGNNIGLRWAHENGLTHAVIANPDTEFSEGCVNAMLNEFSDADVAVVAPICKTPESNYEAPQTGWKLKTWGTELLSKGPICRRLFRGFIEKADMEILSAISSVSKSDVIDVDAVDVDAVDVDAVLGSLLAVDVAKFIEAGGYDDNIFLYCEENILGQKMRSHGYKTRLLINQEYIHNHKPGLPSRRAISNLTASELYYFEKYLGASSLQLLISKIFFGIVYLETCASNN